ncbi:NusA-like transcription termination signal-binding factor [Candidatus Woesearchaeota archaeon]|nr:NusA-like transcription termination signal-binding factor [Candidatus Woesearchaeota archaeon]
MRRLILDQETLGLASLLERRTQVEVKDCFREQDIIYFVVASGQIGKALGKGGRTIQKVQQQIGKRVKVIEYSDKVEEFVKNVILPLTVEQVIQEKGILLIKDDNKKTKSLLIGRDGRNLSIINRAVRRFFAVEVKVV